MWKIYDKYKNRKDLVAAEIGVASGSNARNWIKQFGSFGKLVLVDNYVLIENREYNLNSVRKLASEFNYIEFKYMDSEKAALDYPDEYFDFIYIDADHTLSATFSDLMSWKDKLKKGGCFCGHDYGGNVPWDIDYTSPDEANNPIVADCMWSVKAAVVSFCKIMDIPKAIEFNDHSQFFIKRTW